MATYLRFTLPQVDTESSRKQGVLVAAHELRDNADLAAHEYEQLRLSLAWFNTNLNHPACLKKPENRRALSWYKDSAQKPLEHMWVLKSILEQHGLVVEVHKTTDPGLVLYEDGWQVVAKPRKGQKAAWWRRLTKVTAALRDARVPPCVAADGVRRI